MSTGTQVESLNAPPSKGTMERINCRAGFQDLGHAGQQGSQKILRDRAGAPNREQRVLRCDRAFAVFSAAHAKACDIDITIGCAGSLGHLSGDLPGFVTGIVAELPSWFLTPAALL